MRSPHVFTVLLVAAWGATLLEGNTMAQQIMLEVRPEPGDTTPRRLPCETLAAAVAAARAEPATTARTIVLASGRYALAETLALDARDSGLTLAAAPGATPVLYGGRALTGWEPDGERYWSAPAPGTAAGVWDFRQLYVNGEARPRARLPAQGTWQHASTFDQPWLMTSGGGFVPPPSLEKRTTMVYREGQLPTGFVLKNAEFVILHSWDESQTRASAHDPATRTLRLDPPCGYPPGAFRIQDYYVLNLREGLIQPGQWYLDRERGRVVYWPRPGEDPPRCTIEAPVLNTVLSVVGTKEVPAVGLTLRGLTVDLGGVRLAAPGWGASPFEGAIQLQHVRQCRLEGVTVRRAGGQGVKLLDADDTTVSRCDVAHTGANGIVFLRGARNTIINTRVQFAGEIYPSACGINAGYWTRSRLAHNEVSDCAYCGITLGNGMKEQAPAENTVEYNHVWNVMTGINDGGCLYLYGIERGTVVRGNRLHGARGRTGFAMGLYLDENVEDITCEQNLIYDISRFPLHVHMGKRNVIRHNIFVCGPGREVSFARSSDCVCEGNIFYAPDTGIALVNPGGARFAGNLYFVGKNELKPPPPEADARLADPLVEDAAKGDFRLRADSPALRAGFPVLDLTRAGRQPQ